MSILQYIFLLKRSTGLYFNKLLHKLAHAVYQLTVTVSLIISYFLLITYLHSLLTHPMLFVSIVKL